MPDLDLLAQLVAVADQLGPLAAPPGARDRLELLCATCRSALGAGAASVARVDGESLVYEAAAGAGAAEVAGMRLPVRRGLAGYVARTAQALAVEQVQNDPRFARDVAERTGYVPTSLLVVPVMADDGTVLGVLSVLDRAPGQPNGLEVASGFARLAAPDLGLADHVARLGPPLLAALADAVAQAEPDLAPALRREADRVTAAAEGSGDDGDEADDRQVSLVRLTALLAELQAADPAAVGAAERILSELAALAGRRPRR